MYMIYIYIYSYIYVYTCIFLPLRRRNRGPWPLVLARLAQTLGLGVWDLRVRALGSRVGAAFILNMRAFWMIMIIFI